MVDLIVPDKAKNMVTYMMEAAAAVILLTELQALVKQSAEVPYTQQSDQLAILVAQRIRKLESEIPA